MPMLENDEDRQIPMWVRALAAVFVACALLIGVTLVFQALHGVLEVTFQGTLSFLGGIYMSYLCFYVACKGKQPPFAPRWNYKQ